VGCLFFFFDKIGGLIYLVTHSPPRICSVCR